jgi:hypothetical protein
MRGMDFLVFFLFSSPFSSLVVQPGKVYSTNPGLSKALCPAVREGEQPKKKKKQLGHQPLPVLRLETHCVIRFSCHAFPRLGIHIVSVPFPCSFPFPRLHLFNNRLVSSSIVSCLEHNDRASPQLDHTSTFPS